MNVSLRLHNRQRVRRIDLRYLHRVVSAFLEHRRGAGQCNLGVYLIGRSLITRLNETYLHHQGATDVITFDYRDAGQVDSVEGELFVSLPEAVAQAARFRTTWQSELVRYILHGILHLYGHDDQTVRARRRMKREEDRWVRRLSALFDFRLVGRGTKPAGHGPRCGQALSNLSPRRKLER